MTAKFRKGDRVTNGKTDYLVLRAHRDGRITLRATWGRKPEGGHYAGYLGYVYPYCTTDGLRLVED